MYKSLAALFVTALLAIPAAAQTPAPTAAELLQKAIYAQDTAGDLDGAIKIYHQIADIHPQQREIGAQAQYRLGMALLAKGDSNAASQEIQRLGWDYPDYNNLIASANKAGHTVTFQGANKTFYFQNFEQARAAQQGVAFFEDQVTAQKLILAAMHSKYNGDHHSDIVAAENQLKVLQGKLLQAQQGMQAAVTYSTSPTFTPTSPELQQLAEQRDHALFVAGVTQPAAHEALFDFSKSDTITGTVVEMSLATPYSWLTLNSPPRGLVRVSLASAHALSTAGWTTDPWKPGEPVTVTGAPARDGSATYQATEVSVHGTTLFSRPAVEMSQAAVGAYEK